MEFTRADTAALQAVVDRSVQVIKDLTAELAPFTALLTDTARKRTLRAPSDFAPAGRHLAAGMTEHPDVGAAARYDGEAVIEDLDNVALLSSLVPHLTELQQRIADTILVWNAEAYQHSLNAYGAARALERVRPELRKLVAPMAEIFETRRRGAGGAAGSTDTPTEG